MTFKEQAALDIPTFVNTDEFAVSIIIDGERIACVLEGQEDTEASATGVINRDILMHAPTASFAALPTVGTRIIVDDGATPVKQADIVGVNEEQGIVELRLRWWDS